MAGSGEPRRALGECGVGGLTAAQLRLRLPALLEAYRPKLVVVEAGINDLKLLGLRPEMAPSLVPETAAHLQAIAELSLARGARVLLLEVWPAAEPDLLRRAVWGPAIAVAVQEVNRSLRTFDAPLRGLHVVDLLSTAQLRPAAESYRDTLHLTAAAYEQITPVLEREIAKALNE